MREEMIMKRFYIILAAVAATALVSCQREKDFSDNKPGKNSIVFFPQSVNTRSESQATISRQNIPLDVEIEGQRLYLEETVSMISDVYDAPETRGTPAYTGNVFSLYPSLLGTALKNGSSNVVTTASFDYVKDSNYYEHRYSTSDTPWNVSDDLYFFLQMPADLDINPTYGVADGKMKATFDYTSPSKAKDQQDIIFAGTALTYDEYKNTYEEGHKPVPVTFNHALTGVKFALGNDNSGDTKTHVTSVTFHGLKKSGTATIIPDLTGKSADRVSWVLGEETGSFLQEYVVGEYDDNTKDNTVTYDKETDANNFGKESSFYTAGTNRNLNDEAASLTFWFIPQAMTDEVTVEVDFYVSIKNALGQVIPGESKTLVLNLGERLGSSTTWEAGQLRTYTIKPDIVDVAIHDTVSDQEKSDVVIDNTGNVPIYVRVNIIGNWVGKHAGHTEETVLMGFTSSFMEDEVARWNDKDGAGTWTSGTGRTYDYIPYGTFTNMPPAGTKTEGGALTNNWRRHDKYYYYTQAIGPGESIGSGTSRLFTKYQINRTPEFWIPNNAGVAQKATDVHLVMDVVVQAILAPKVSDDPITYMGYEEAWTAALNPNNADPTFNFNDL